MDFSGSSSLTGESIFISYIEAWLEACADIPDTPRVTENSEHRLLSDRTHLGVTDIKGVIGCQPKSDLPTIRTITENTSSEYRHCTDAAGQYKVDGTMVMSTRGDILSTILAEIKARSNSRHTIDRLPPQASLTRAGILAKPPEEPSTAKLVVVEPTTVSPPDIDNHNPFFSAVNSSHLIDVEDPSRYQVGSSHRLTDTHIRSKRDVKGKLPMGTI